ncbi:MAG: four-carbon acid sugar kinase family protein [Chitinophagaceae bacterium]|nr:MAG: four-carbon acid sugar kinase family protein [Chitinophagaceae bacterium]
MIVVIADDITGAAELAGIALRYGLRVLLSRQVSQFAGFDVLCLYTNTRSLQKEEAVAVMKELASKVADLSPSLIYKKTDSVLRGYVLAEMEAQMKVLNLEKALLVPANPLLGRTIKHGNYYLNDQPIHETSFSSDPEFPIRSSKIKDMLGAENIPIHVLKKNTELQAGISVGEAVSMKDVESWAKYDAGSVLLAGAASFFSALLKAKYPVSKKTFELKLATPMLLVSGTTYKKNVDRRKELQHLISYMPVKLFSKNTVDEKLLGKWADETLGILSTYGNAIVAIGDHGDEKADSKLLREKLSKVVNRILDVTEIRELLIEGGSTAFSIIHELGLSSFVPTDEISQGVVRMKAEGNNELHLTIKPGSYDWPPQWHFNE